MEQYLVEDIGIEPMTPRCKRSVFPAILIPQTLNEPFYKLHDATRRHQSDEKYHNVSHSESPLVKHIEHIVDAAAARKGQQQSDNEPDDATNDRVFKDCTNQ